MKFEDLNAFYGSLEQGELSNNSECHYGQPCVLLDEKNKFHRAVLQSDVDANGEFKVFLIDKGLKRFAKQHSLRQIVPEFLAFPPLVSLFNTIQLC
jgi:hypothetical protein